MAKLSKRQKALTEIDRNKHYGVDEAIGIVKANATAKFDETVEIALNWASTRATPTRWSAESCRCPRAPARTSASRCSPRATRPRKPEGRRGSGRRRGSDGADPGGQIDFERVIATPT